MPCVTEIGGRHKSAMKKFALLFLLFAFNFALAASGDLDKAASKVTVRVYKSGFFSAFAHDHTIAAPIASGHLDTEKSSVGLKFSTQEMKVMDHDASESDRAEIERTMKSDKVLNVARFPAIKFVSTYVEKRDPNGYLVRGDLTLHGV